MGVNACTDPLVAARPGQQVVQATHVAVLLRFHAEKGRGGQGGERLIGADGSGRSRSSLILLSLRDLDNKLSRLPATRVLGDGSRLLQAEFLPLQPYSLGVGCRLLRADYPAFVAFRVA